MRCHNFARETRVERKTTASSNPYRATNFTLKIYKPSFTLPSLYKLHPLFSLFKFFFFIHSVLRDINLSPTLCYVINFPDLCSCMDYSNAFK